MSPSPVWPADFLDAHDRYWEDGEKLFGDGRWATADHLYGLCAECGLKAVMVAGGMPTTASGVPTDEYRVHVDLLWDKFVSFAQGRRVQRYAALLQGANPFGDWSVHQRYAHRRHFERKRVEAHRDGASLVRSMVSEARRDGVLR